MTVIKPEEPEGWAPKMYDDIDAALSHIVNLLNMIEELDPEMASEDEFILAEKFLEDFND